MHPADYLNADSREKQRIAGRHAIALLITWAFFVKIVPHFMNTGTALSGPAMLVSGISQLMTTWGLWLIPLCLCADYTVGRMAFHEGGPIWQRRWARAVETCLCSMIVFAIFTTWFGRAH